MVAATATTNGKFLRDTQAGQGFSRIDYLSFGTSNFIGVNSRLAGDGGQQLQKIEGAALGRKQGATVGFDSAKQLVGSDSITVFCMPVDSRLRVEPGDTFIEPRSAAKHSGFSGYYRGLDLAIARYEAGCQISGADIFGKCGVDIANNFLGKRKIKIDKHSGVWSAG